MNSVQSRLISYVYYLPMIPVIFNDVKRSSDSIVHGTVVKLQYNIKNIVRTKHRNIGFIGTYKMSWTTSINIKLHGKKVAMFVFFHFML